MDTRASLFSKPEFGGGKVMEKKEKKDVKDKKDIKDKDKKSKRASTVSNGHTNGNGNGKADAGAQDEGESLFTDPELVKYLFNPSGKLIPMSAPAPSAVGGAPNGYVKRKSGAGYIALPVYHAQPAEQMEEGKGKERSDKVLEAGLEKGDAVLEERAERMPKKGDGASVMSGDTAVASVAGGEKGKAGKKARKGSAWDTM